MFSGRMVVVGPNDVNFEKGALKPGAKPKVIGDPLPLKAMRFRSPPKLDPKYAPLYRKAYKLASEACAKNPELSLTEESLRIAEELIQAYETQFSGEPLEDHEVPSDIAALPEAQRQAITAARQRSQEKASESSQSRPFPIMSEPKVTPASIVRDAEAKIARKPKQAARTKKAKRIDDMPKANEVDDLLKDLEAFEQPRQRPARPSGRRSPQKSSVDLSSWPETPRGNPESLELEWPEQVKSGHWLNLDGLGPEPLPPSFAVKFTTAAGSIVIPCQWILENPDLDGETQSYVIVYDRRFDGKSYTTPVKELRCNDPGARIEIAEIVNGRISPDGVDRVEVEPFADSFHLGDLGIISFYIAIE